MVFSALQYYARALQPVLYSTSFENWSILLVKQRTIYSTTLLLFGMVWHGSAAYLKIVGMSGWVCEALLYIVTSLCS